MGIVFGARGELESAKVALKFASAMPLARMVFLPFGQREPLGSSSSRKAACASPQDHTREVFFEELMRKSTDGCASRAATYAKMNGSEKEGMLSYACA